MRLVVVRLQHGQALRVCGNRHDLALLLRNELHRGAAHRGDGRHVRARKHGSGNRRQRQKDLLHVVVPIHTGA